jgi:threonine/homoserine/homoserine lactone efflux protein
VTLGPLFLTSLAVGFSGAVTPGPLLVACLTQSARDGCRGGLLVTVGHAILELLAVVGLSLGLGDILTRPGVAPAISLVGGLFLVWMGYGTARVAWRGDMALPVAEHTGQSDPVAARKDPAGRQGAVGAAVTGMAATVSGPFWALWWATVGLSYLTLARPLGAPGLAAFYLGHVSADFIWYSAVALAVAGGRRLLTARGYKILLVACGLLLVVLGGWFGLQGLLSTIRT